MFGELKKGVIEDSFTMGNDLNSTTLTKDDDGGKMKVDLNKPLLEQIIISNESVAYQLWYNLYVFCCLISSYFYAYMAAFTFPEKGDFLFILDNVFETIFYISFFLCFIVDFQPPDSPKPVKDVSKIAMRYLKGNFIYDVIPLIPFPYIPLKNKDDRRLFYIIKIIRLVVGLRILSVPRIMEKIKKIYEKKL